MISERIARHLNDAPERIVIREMGGRSYALSELRAEVERIARGLEASFGPCDRLVFGIAMRSSYAWVTAMLAIMRVRGVLLPVPIEFSDEQIGSLLGKATAIFVGDDGTRQRIERILPGKLCLTHEEIDIMRAPKEAVGERIETGILAIIHTSGTTSRPKGVKIRDEAVGILIEHVMRRLPDGSLHYLSIVPMSLLIEQVLGVFIPVLSGGTLTLMEKDVPEYGAQSGNATRYLALISQAGPNFLYLPPKLLEEADSLLEDDDPATLFGKERPHIITGGAKIPVNVLQSLDRKGVAVFEAYGLSENSSIISLNYPGCRQVGSVGPLLDGIESKIVDGELLVRTPTLCAGYYNSDDTACDLSDGYLHTGDIAEIRDGFLYITGRKKHVIILSTARNISPEWVETVYKESPLIDDIIVMGEGREEPVAIVLSVHSDEDILADMRQLETRLADFARVRRIQVIRNFGQFRNDYYTVTGRPRRQLIERDLGPSLYR